MRNKYLLVTTMIAASSITLLLMPMLALGRPSNKIAVEQVSKREPVARVGDILAITVSVPDVEEVERAYSKWLHYVTTSRGKISRELATVWDTPRMEGRPYVIMQPANNAKIYLRFVQLDAVKNYVPMRTIGWNAIEILVKDPVALSKVLAQRDSPFKIIGPPRPIGPNSLVHAMQVVGPADEVLYLTNPGQTFLDESGDQMRTFVDRPFIVILGGTRIDVMLKFYELDLGLTVRGSPMKGRITVLNKAFGLDVNSTHRIGMARASSRYSIEVDEYPRTASPRYVRRGELPTAIAMVGFETASLDAFKLPFLATPRAIEGPPYDGRRVGVIRGATGELIELIESKRLPTNPVDS